MQAVVDLLLAFALLFGPRVSAAKPADVRRVGISSVRLGSRGPYAPAVQNLCVSVSPWLNHSVSLFDPRVSLR